MSDILDKVVYYFVRHESKGEREEILQAAEQRIKEQIITKIKDDVRSEERTKAKEEIEAEENEKKLDELKDIIWSAFLVAFLVGLLVNQVTDIITLFKNGSIQWTVIIICLLLLLCLVVFFIMFVSKIKKIYEAIKRK